MLHNWCETALLKGTLNGPPCDESEHAPTVQVEATLGLEVALMLTMAELNSIGESESFASCQRKDTTRFCFQARIAARQDDAESLDLLTTVLRQREVDVDKQFFKEQRILVKCQISSNQKCLEQTGKRVAGSKMHMIPKQESVGVLKCCLR